MAACIQADGAPMMGKGAARIMLNGVINGNHAQPMNNDTQAWTVVIHGIQGLKQCPSHIFGAQYLILQISAGGVLTQMAKFDQLMGQLALHLGLL